MADEFKMLYEFLNTSHFAKTSFSDSDNNSMQRRCDVCVTLAPSTNVTTYLLTLFAKHLQEKEKTTKYAQ